MCVYRRTDSEIVVVDRTWYYDKKQGSVLKITDDPSTQVWYYAFETREECESKIASRYMIAIASADQHEHWSDYEGILFGEPAFAFAPAGKQYTNRLAKTNQVYYVLDYGRAVCPLSMLPLTNNANRPSRKEWQRPIAFSVLGALQNLEIRNFVFGTITPENILIPCTENRTDSLEWRESLYEFIYLAHFRGSLNSRQWFASLLRTSGTPSINPKFDSANRSDPSTRFVTTLDDFESFIYAIFDWIFGGTDDILYHRKNDEYFKDKLADEFTNMLIRVRQRNAVCRAFIGKELARQTLHELVHESDCPPNTALAGTDRFEIGIPARVLAEN